MAPSNLERDGTPAGAKGITGILRPNLSLTLRGPGKKAELYLDAKYSYSDRYLKYSATKMLAGLTDRASSNSAF